MKIKQSRGEGLHEIKHKRPTRVEWNKKERQPVLTAKKRSRLKKAAALCCAIATVAGGAFALGFFNTGTTNPINEGYGSVKYEIKKGEKFSLSTGYSSVEIFGRLNWKFANQTKWYSEMDSSIDIVAIGIPIKQSVHTYKQYENSILIATELTTSPPGSFVEVNSAREFCYIGDRVIWREASGGADTYNGLETPWKTGEPAGNMQISGENGFRAKNGLPATELSAYIIDETTVLNKQDEPTENADGTFTIVYELDPAIHESADGGFEGAPVYYANQMMFSGGLKEPPTHDSIRITYTFDSDWQVLSCAIAEQYTAVMGVEAKCSSTSLTTYEYNTDRAKSNEYENYFKDYMDAPVMDSAPEKEITATDCLAEGFAPVLTSETVFDVSLDLNGTPLQGQVYVYLPKKEIRADLGIFKVWYTGGAVYLRYGDLNARLTVDEFTKLIQDLLPAEEGDQEEEGGLLSGGTDGLLAAITGGEFVCDGTSASLKSNLPLLGLEIPLEFRFAVDENKKISFDEVTTQVDIKDFALAARLCYGTKAPAALEEGEKAAYVELTPYARTLAELFTSETLHADIKYAAEKFTVEAAADVKIGGGLENIAAKGVLSVLYKSAKKSVAFSYAGGEVCIALDGIQIKASVEEAVALIEQYITLPELPQTGGLDLDTLIENVLSAQFASNFTLEETDSLHIGIKGTELLKTFGVDFALGDVKLAVDETSLAADALGAEIEIMAGDAFEIGSTDAYTDIVKYASAVAEMIKAGYLHVDGNYVTTDESLKVDVSADVKLDEDLQATAEVTLTYKNATPKTVNLVYTDKAVYLDLDGLKVSATVDGIVSLVKQFVAIPEQDTQANDLLEQVLDLNFGDIIKLKEADTGDTLQLTVAGTELLNALGVDLGTFDLGDIELNIGSDNITASVYGVHLTVSATDSLALGTLTGYTDIVKYANAVAEMIKAGYLHVEGNYATKDESLKVDVSADVKLDEDLQATAEVVLTYKNATPKTVNLVYTDKAVYLDLDGLKVSATVDGIVSLVKQFVAIPEQDTQANDLLEQVLNLDFGNIIKLKEADTHDTLQLTVAGTELLNALGVDLGNFDLGDIELTIGSDNITVSVHGVHLTVSATDSLALGTLTGYIDIGEYANAVAALIKGGYLAADVHYEAKDITVKGNLRLDIRDFDRIAAQGSFDVQYKSAHQTLELIYIGGAVYLNVGGLKVSGGTEELVAFVKSILAKDEAGAGSDLNLDTVLEKLLADRIGNLIGIEANAESGAIELTLAGNAILSALGVEFNLGSVELAVAKSGKITAKALDATVTAEGTEPFVVAAPADYTDIVKYAETVAALIEGKNLGIAADYKGGELILHAEAQLGLEPMQVKAELTLTYAGATKIINVIYAGDVLYLQLEGLKVQTTLAGATALIGQFVEIPESDTGAKDLVEEILKLDFTEIVTELKEADGKLQLTLAGTELLKAFAVNFDLGDVKLSIGTDSITANAYGADITLKACEPFTVETKDYVDITPIMGALPAILEAKAISFNGAIALNIKDTEIVLNVKEGVISWNSGIEAYLSATLSVLGTEHDISLYVTNESVKLAYGAVGAEVVYSELPDLEEAFLQLYGRISAIAEGATGEGLPAIEGIDDLLALLKGGEGTTSALSSLIPQTDKADGSGKEIDIGAILKQLGFAAGTKKGSILKVTYSALTVELLNELTAEGGTLGLDVLFADEKVSISALLHAAAFEGGMPKMPNAEYLGLAEFKNMLDFVGAAVSTLAEQNLSIDLIGQVTSTDTETYPDGVKYDFTSNISYYSGATFPFHIEKENKNFYVNPDLYLHVVFDFEARAENEDSLYFDITIFDGDNDGTLDFYVSVSAFAKGNASRDPLLLYAPADEIMTVLSAGLSLLGVDRGILNDYLISKWLSLQTAESMRALGANLLPRLTELVGFDLSEIGSLLNFDFGAKKQDGASAKERDAETARGNFLAALRAGDEEFTLSLSSHAIYGIEGLDDITLTLKKENGEGGSRLTFAGVAGAYNKTGTEKTSVSLTIGRAEAEKSVPDLAGYYNFLGIDSFLVSLVKSATHGVDADGEIISGEQAAHTYKLNETFYIDGSLGLNLKVISIDAIDVTVKVVAISVNIDENNELGANVRLEFDHVKKFGIVAINGDTQVDLTLKHGMIYIRRVVTSDADGKTLPVPETIYRAMPLENFGNSIVPQVGFLFNLGSTITKYLPTDNGTTTDPAPAAKEDFGTQLKNVLTSFTYAPAKDGDSWTLVLNGNALTNGLLGNITVKIGADKEQFIRTLTLGTRLSVTGVDIDFAGELTYHNPGGKMDDGVKDITTDVADTLERAMDAKLRTVDWSATEYLEGQLISVRYVLGDDVLDTQEIVIDPTTKELYGDFAYPSLEGYDTMFGYHPSWIEPSKENIGSGIVVYARYIPVVYTFVFRSTQEIAGYDMVREGLWERRVEWTFGTPLDLVFGENERQFVAKFVDASGNSPVGDCNAWSWLKEGETVFDAVWEDIVYTVVFDVNGEETTLTGSYGESIVAPEGYADAKMGYSFDKWSEPFATFGEDGQKTREIAALYTPNQYNVTLVSDRAIAYEGFEFTLQNDGAYTGKYTATFVFTYDDTVSIPSAYRDGAYFLDGFTLREGDEEFYITMPNVTGDTVLYAKWSENAVSVKFEAEGFGTVAEHNYKVGAQLSNLPAVPEKKGYTGRWNIPEGYTVPSVAETVIYAEYTPITYTFTLTSSFAIEDFAGGEGGFTKEIRYTYGEADIALPEGTAYGYDFLGFYLAEGGEERIEQLGKAFVESIGYRNATLQARWFDNSVTVRLYSDNDFEGSEGKDAIAYYKMYTRTREQGYALNETLVSKKSGYTQLAWWYEGESGWERVTDIEKFRGQNVAIYAMWIEAITAKITTLELKREGLIAYCTIGGVASGGDVYGDRGKTIFNAVGAVKTVTGGYKIFGSTASESDNLKWGSTFVLAENGGFYDERMMSSNAGYKWVAKYGGVEITVTFQYGDLSVSTKYSAIVSQDAYSVKFVDDLTGAIIKEEIVRADCPFDDDDNTTYFADIMAATPFPEKEGHEGHWEYDENEGVDPVTGAVIGNKTIHAHYTINKYVVRFESANEVPTWQKDEEKKIWYYETEMYYGSIITYNVLTSSSVTVGATKHVFTLPADIDNGARVGTWAEPVIDEHGATFNVVYAPDKISYHSDIDFTYQGASAATKDYSETFDSMYTLITPVAEGYTFLGWFQKVGESWKQVTVLSIGESYTETKVEALWMSNLNVDITNANYKYAGWRSGHDYTIQATITGGELKGVFASEDVQVQTTYRFFADNSTDNSTTASNVTKSFNKRTASHSETFFIQELAWEHQKNAHVAVDLSFSYGEWTYQAETGYACKAF